jgi:phospholipid/cholesterol/gamma-HCH transport system substrate-binding protein
MTGLLSSARLRRVVTVVLVALLGSGIYVIWPRPQPLNFTAEFTSAVGLYKGDDVKVAGVKVGTITSITPTVHHTTITMTVDRSVPLPADARALLVAPNLVSARFIEVAPVYTKGPLLSDGATIGLNRTAVPVEWDDIKAELTKLSVQLGPQPGSLEGPLTKFVNQAADTLDGRGDSFRNAVRELSQTAGRLGDSRSDLLGTVKNLNTLVDALSRSNEEIVEFSGHIAAVSQVLADSSSDIDTAMGTLNHALSDVRGFLADNNATLVAQVDKLADFSKMLNDHGEDIEQILHVAPNALANFYNMYNPAQGSVAGILTLPFMANPVQFICGSIEAGATPDYYKRGEICRERMGPVLKRLSVNYPPILFHPITSITAYKGQIAYDTPQTEAKARTPVAQLKWQPAPGVTPPPANSDLSALLLPPPSPPPPGALGSPPGTPAPPKQGSGR